MIRHGLMSSRRKVQDSQTGVNQSYGRERLFETFVVGSTMAQCGEQSPTNEGAFVTNPDQSAYPAHSPVLSGLRASVIPPNQDPARGIRQNTAITRFPDTIKIKRAANNA